MQEALVNAEALVRAIKEVQLLQKRGAPRLVVEEAKRQVLVIWGHLEEELDAWLRD